jgi:hypothetical protein
VPGRICDPEPAACVFRFPAKGDRAVEQATTSREALEERAGDIDADEVIDAFDHVLEALDQVIQLAEFARSRGPDALYH